MSLFTRARRHVDMKRVKELREEKIKEKTIAEVQKQQEDILAELKKIEIKESPKYSNWRRELKDLSEQMTTVDMGMINLEPSPNVLSNEISAFDSASATVANVVSGGSVKLGVDQGQPFTDVLSGSNHTQLRQASFNFDSTRYDTFVINITNPGGGQGEWCDPSCIFDNIVRYLVLDSDNLNSYILGTLNNGDNTIQVPSNLRVKNVEVGIYQYASDGVYSDGYNPPFTINAISTKRLTPISLFVSLDDPEANSFIRDGQTDKLSPAEKKKKLEDQLKAGSDYLDKMFGKDVMPKGATKIADYEPQQSFMDIQVGDERITKVNNKTVTDTTKKIKDGKMDGKPIYYDNQGNMRVSEPKPQPKPQPKSQLKPQPKSTTTTTSNTDKTPSWSITDAPKTTTFTSTTDTSSYEDREGYKTGIPAVDYSADIAASIKSNTPVNIPQKNIPKDQINKLINAINPNNIGEYGIPINSTPQPYSDDHFYELPNGEVRKHTASSRAKYPNNTSSLSSGNAGFMGKGNPLGVAGKAQAQFVAPKDGSEPYYQYTDHAYVNSAQMGGGEIPDPIKTLGAIGVHAASGYGKKYSPLDSPYHQTGGVLDTTTPNTGKMKNYPSNIRGDVRKQIKVPLSQMPPKVQDAVNKQIKLDKQLLGSVKEEVLTEKKRLKSPKSVVDKIPGYYDGKPSPLGFPVEEPPKMVNGYHPDLVDGKKVANRFNRLDPISARSMPKTGNPHIDKKVRAAAKKPK